jgi:hypothetical protein
MEQTDAEFSCNYLVIWARKQRLVHLDAGIGNQGASGQDGERTGEAERESRGKIFHVRWKEDENFYRLSRQYKASGDVRIRAAA